MVSTVKEAFQNRFDKKALNIVVSTIQTFRTSSKDGRKFYDENGNFENNFSLAEYIKSEKPVIILDEAHKSNTKLSYESLLNLDPVFILELTATPNII